MKKILSIISAAMLSTAVSAQETYDNAPLAQKDLNGTARYVGMGGAMEALGADISTIGTNPAGIGLFRRSMVNGTFGLNTQSDATSFRNADKTNMSFDQAGFVYTMRSNYSSFVNFGFSYTKSKNFDQILTAADRLNGAYFSSAEYVVGVLDKGFVVYLSQTSLRLGVTQDVRRAVYSQLRFAQHYSHRVENFLTQHSGDPALGRGRYVFYGHDLAVRHGVNESVRYHDIRTQPASVKLRRGVLFVKLRELHIISRRVEF